MAKKTQLLKQKTLNLEPQSGSLLMANLEFTLPTKLQVSRAEVQKHLRRHEEAPVKCSHGGKQREEEVPINKEIISRVRL